MMYIVYIMYIMYVMYLHGHWADVWSRTHAARRQRTPQRRATKQTQPIRLADHDGLSPTQQLPLKSENGTLTGTPGRRSRI